MCYTGSDGGCMDVNDVKTGVDALVWIAQYRSKHSAVLDDFDKERLRRQELADLDFWEKKILDDTALVANDNNTAEH